MKKIKNILVISAALCLASCNNFLDESSKLTQSTEVTMASFQGLDKATAGAYSPLYSTGWYSADYILDSEMRSGNGRRDKSGNYSSNRYTQPYDWNYSSDNYSGIWARAYYIISAANNVINNLEGKTSTEVAQQDIDNIKAECLFLRALSHFDLVRIYAQPYTYQPQSLGVPVVLVTDPNGAPARNTVAETYDQVISDLLEAESIISPSYVRDNLTDDKAAVNIYSIQALLSRVYLYMGNWQKAADYATKVIDSKKFNVWTASEYSDLKTWGAITAADGGEVIFEVFGDKGNSYWGSWNDISYMTKPDGYADTQISADAIALFDADDIRTKLFRGHKDDETGEKRWTCKYIGKTGEQRDVNNIIVLRISEMYLNRAEAIINGASVPGVTAASDVNQIRTNRGLSSVLAVTNYDLRLERRKEFLYEGHYIFDLARWNLPVERSVEDYTGDVNSRNIDFPSYRWALPIPKRETDINTNLVQNPNY